MWEHYLHLAGIISYVAILVAVSIYGFHRYMLVYLYFKHRYHIYEPRGRFAQLPRRDRPVADVQRGRRGRAGSSGRPARLTTRASCWKSRSWMTAPITPPTSRDAPAKKWAAKGVPIKYIHRTNREGYKAGALSCGLKQASGEFIAIFDADFVPRATSSPMS